MTDKPDLSEEIAALRRAVGAQAVMVKQALNEIEQLQELVRQPHARLAAVELRLHVLENWQLDANATLNAMNTPAPPLPSGPSDYVPANDNNPSKRRPQKLKLLDEIDAVLKGHKHGIVSGDIWMLLTDLDAVLDQHRRGCHE